MENPVFTHSCRVAFGDTDASGWMHFPNVFHYFEQAEHAFLRSKGVLVFDRALGGWPRVHVTCDYKKPLHCGDRITVQLAIRRLGTASVEWCFEILDADGHTTSQGAVTTVRVGPQGKPQPLSDDERTALQSGGGQ